MANTVMTAKNTFAEGLIMDFSPDNTQASCMTSALNATVLTFNGNEMSLQNDMGNGRVETAFLPEGYIPVGTCEFGDIIYIVSYNPLTDKSQIGCFPSPERNISSEEMSQVAQNLGYTEFQSTNVDGTLKRTSIKKVLIEKKLNPGDKYIIYTDDPNSINGSNSILLSDWGQGKHNVDPRTIKLHVVSIEDSGKITYLDSSTKWYGNYYVNTTKKDSTNPNSPPDIDSYRNLLSSGWSIFNSKVPGKLAILAELETIDSFSCSYLVEMVRDPYRDGNIIYKEYKIKLIPSYSSKEKLAAPHVCATKATFNNEEGIDTSYVSFYSINSNSMQTMSATSFTPSINQGWKNIVNGGIIEMEGTFKIPYKEVYKDKEYPIYSDSFIYNLEITPAMDFGRLDYLKVLLTIDFNKIGTGEVDFNLWKYYNSEEGAMLTFGINTYPKPGYDVKCIVMDFYDNQGKVMQYLLDGRKSYNGIFNEYFSLNGKSSNSRMSRYEIDSITNKDWTIKPSEWKDAGTKTVNGEQVSNNLIVHKGDTLKEALEFPDEYIKETTNGETVYYQNDSGIIYFGALYAVKIRVYQGIINDGKASPEEINNSVKEPEPYYRWYWTTSMFNEYYYNTNDFGNLKFELMLDSQAVFETNPSTYIWKTKEVNNLGEDFGTDQFYKTYSANIQYIGKDKEPNINMYIRAGLKNDYGCFNLYDKGLSTIKSEVFLSTGEIKYDLKSDEYVFSGEYGNITDPWFLYKENIIKTDGNGLSGMLYIDSPINTKKVETQKEILLKDDFNITFPTKTEYLPEGAKLSTQELEDDNELNVQCQILETTLDKCYYQNNDKKEPIQLCMASTIFNKAYVQNIYASNISVPVYTPIIDSIDDLYQLGIDYYPINGNIRLCFNNAINLNQCNNRFTITNFNFDQTSGRFVSPVEQDDDQNSSGESGKGFKANDIMVDPSTNKNFLEEEWSYVSSLLPEMFLVYPGGSSDTNCYGVVGSSPYSFIDVTKWVTNHQENSPNLSNSKTKTEITPNKTGKAYDINNGVFTGINDYNTVAFLGMKFKDGFTLLNSAFKDSHTGNTFNQVATRKGVVKEYENFAYQLYLLLSNTYHKNKRTADEQINLKNYVRNGDSNINFTKNIIVRLSEMETDQKNNMLMRGCDFNAYVQLVKDKSGIGDSSESNITLKFIDSAINNVLNITIKSIPLSFIGVDAAAYIMRNGTLKPSFNLANNTFYIYQNDELQTYQNKILNFDVQEVGRNLKYILGQALADDAYFQNNTTPKLVGVHPPISKYETDFQKIYNKFVDLVRDAVNAIHADPLESKEFFYETLQFETPEQLRGKKSAFISAIMEKLPDTIDGYSKYYLQQYAYNDQTDRNNYGYPYDQYGWFGRFEVFFDTRPISNTSYGGQAHFLEIRYYNNMVKEESQKEATEYTFNCGFHLTRAFQYDTKLILNSERTYSKFGLKDNPNDDGNYNQAYGGFMQDVIIDKTFQVVP